MRQSLTPEYLQQLRDAELGTQDDSSSLSTEQSQPAQPQDRPMVAQSDNPATLEDTADDILPQDIANTKNETIKELDGITGKYKKNVRKIDLQELQRTIMAKYGVPSFREGRLWDPRLDMEKWNLIQVRPLDCNDQRWADWMPVFLYPFTWSIKSWPPAGVKLPDYLVGQGIRMLQWGKITGKELGLRWPADFDRDGTILKYRRPLGFPYLIRENGKTWVAAANNGIHLLCGASHFDPIEPDSKQAKWKWIQKDASTGSSKLIASDICAKPEHEYVWTDQGAVFSVLTDDQKLRNMQGAIFPNQLMQASTNISIPMRFVANDTIHYKTAYNQEGLRAELAYPANRGPRNDFLGRVAEEAFQLEIPTWSAMSDKYDKHLKELVGYMNSLADKNPGTNFNRRKPYWDRVPPDYDAYRTWYDDVKGDDAPDYDELPDALPRPGQSTVHQSVDTDQPSNLDQLPNRPMPSPEQSSATLPKKAIGRSKGKPIPFIPIKHNHPKANPKAPKTPVTKSPKTPVTKSPKTPMSNLASKDKSRQTPAQSSILDTTSESGGDDNIGQQDEALGETIEDLIKLTQSFEMVAAEMLAKTRLATTSLDKMIEEALEIQFEQVCAMGRLNRDDQRKVRRFTKGICDQVKSCLTEYMSSIVTTASPLEQGQYNLKGTVRANTVKPSVTFLPDRSIEDRLPAKIPGLTHAKPVAKTEVANYPVSFTGEQVALHDRMFATHLQKTPSTTRKRTKEPSNYEESSASSEQEDGSRYSSCISPTPKPLDKSISLEDLMGKFRKKPRRSA